MKRKRYCQWHFRPRNVANKLLVIGCLTIILLSTAVILHSLLLFCFQSTDAGAHSLTAGNGKSLQVDFTAKQTPWKSNCTLTTCFESDRCRDGRLTVYLYPLVNYSNERLFKQHPIPVLPYSREFLELRRTIKSSRYLASNAANACLFLPNVDLLNLRNFEQNRSDGNSRTTVESVRAILASLPFWRQGRNHILISFLPTSETGETLWNLNTGRALIASAGFPSRYYRNPMDISIPIWYPPGQDSAKERLRSTKVESGSWEIVCFEQERRFFVKLNSGKTVLRVRRSGGAKADIWKDISADSRRAYDRQSLMLASRLCLFDYTGSVLSQRLLLDALQFKCLPIIVTNDDVLLPFQEVLDWKRFSKRLYPHQTSELTDIVAKISSKESEWLSAVGNNVWREHFSTLPKIVLTMLNVIEERLFPSMSNDGGNPAVGWEYGAIEVPPLFLERTAPFEGFTAVILGYERVASLYATMRMVARARSCVKIILIWNNPDKDPPHAKDFPNIGRPIHVARMKRNRLTNRYFPLDVIETEAVFSLDDDISMLTTDEIEFAYQAWREFPNSLVGFPSRVHIWNETTSSYMYNSEWTSDISLILTGAAFYHKHYGYLFHKVVPKAVLRHIDHVMNCEDIAFNFFLAKISQAPLIKVTPRKRFLCKNCANTGLSANNVHIKDRSECLNIFKRIFGGVSLRTVQFRLDPVQYGLDVSQQEFADIGTM